MKNVNEIEVIDEIVVFDMLDNVQYKGYSIYKNPYSNAKFPNFDYLFHNTNDCDEPQGAGMDIEDCKDQINQLKNRYKS